MVTMKNVDSALKEIYLESVVNEINNKTNPFLTMIQKNAKEATGSEARVHVRYGNSGAVATGLEGGLLPVSDGRSAEIVSSLKNLYGSVQVSDKALKAAKHNPGAVAALLTDEMKNLIATAQNSLDAMLYGNGLKYLGYTDSYNPATQEITVPMRFIKNFSVGQAIKFLNSNNEIQVENFSVVAIAGDKVKLNAGVAPDFVRHDRLFIYDLAVVDQEISGIDAIFRQDKLYNLNRAEVTDILPFIKSETTVNVIMNEARVMQFLDACEEYTQGAAADIILTHPITRRALFDDVKNVRTNVDASELAGGFKGFSFNGIPAYADVKCKAGVLYALNSDSWALHQLEDWSWIKSEEGSVLTPMAGKAGYSAAITKYCELICEKPFLQGKLANHSAKRSV